jgi:hypothetical protein
VTTLIRTDEDHGTATILDRRLVSRRWGRLLMRGLPDFELVIEPAGRRAAAGSGVDERESGWTMLAPTFST